MGIFKYILFIIWITLLYNSYVALAGQTTMPIKYRAVITQPVADLLGQPMQTSATQKIRSYNALPVCGGSVRPDLSCPRIHQALFNECVDVLEERGDEVRISISTVFFTSPLDNSPQTTYWTLKKYITPYASIPDAHNIIPQPIDFRTREYTTNPHIIALALPFHDTVTQQQYSAGTRFIYTKCTKHAYTVTLYDPKAVTNKVTHIPSQQCVLVNSHTPTERINNFVHILKKWAHLKHGCIPYVWGGCSFTTPVPPTHFNEVTQTIAPGIITSWYARTMKSPKAGFDCTGLVARAAQLCGMPYFLKNSTTITKTLRPLVQGEHLENGDIIWTPGHVIIVSDIQKQLAIEARSYRQGYGKVHEIPIDHLFQGITTYNTLVTAFLNKKSLLRLNNKKQPYGEPLETFSLLKIKSIYES